MRCACSFCGMIYVSKILLRKKGRLVTKIKRVNGLEYEVSSGKAILGQGGQGTVWRVVREGCEYAIKEITLRSDKKRKAENERIRQEVEYCKQFHSENIVRIIDSEERTVDEASQNVLLSCVMPMYSCTLRDYIAPEVSLDTKFSLLSQLFGAVVQIHDDHIVHRDIKPENVLVDESCERAVLADFGIAHFDGAGVTVDNDMLMNRYYYAPEQRKGAGATNVASSADVFSLGLILNEMFTLNVPRGESYLKIADEYPLLSELDDLVVKMTVQDPDERLEARMAKLELERIIDSFRDALNRVKDEVREFSCYKWERWLCVGKEQAVNWNSSQVAVSQKDGSEVIESVRGWGEGRSVEHVSVMQSLERGAALSLESYQRSICPGRDSEGVLFEIETDIYRQAAEDLLLADRLIRTLSVDEWERVNINYRHNIRFSPDVELKNAVASVQVLEACRRKFRYEANVYSSFSDSRWQDPYSDGPEKCHLIELDRWLEGKQFALDDFCDSYHVHKLIRKYFVSCGREHCSEILGDMMAVEARVNNMLSMYESVIQLAYYVAVEVFSKLQPQEVPYRLVENFSLGDYVVLSEVTHWPLDSFYQTNAYARSLWKPESMYVEMASPVLNALIVDYPHVMFRFQGDHASVYFSDHEEHQRFVDCALNFGRQDYVFEGDVQSLLNARYKGRNFVHYVWSLGFDVQRTLAIILGRRSLS